MNDENWNIDLICSEDGVIGKYEYESFNDIKYANAATSTKIFNRIIRHKLYDILYKRKNDSEYFSDRMEK